MNIVRLLLFIIIFLLLTSIAWFVVEMATDAWSRGFRYWTLIAEMVVFPLAFLLVLFLLGRRLYAEKSVTPKTIRTSLKCLALMFGLMVISLLAGMIFNDINAPGSHI